MPCLFLALWFCLKRVLVSRRLLCTEQEQFLSSCPQRSSGSPVEVRLAAPSSRLTFPSLSVPPFAFSLKVSPPTGHAPLETPLTFRFVLGTPPTRGS